MNTFNIINELVVSNITESIEFYNNYFGFVVEQTDGNPISWVQLSKNGETLMLEDYKIVESEIHNYPKKANSSNIIKFEYNNLDEFKELYNKLKENKIEFIIEYTETDYGKVEFGIYDLDRNIILISSFMNI